MLYATVTMISLLPAVMAAGAHDAKQECSCAQHEADHPFTIDCAKKSVINAATRTLESAACKKPRSDTFEWSGTFDTPKNAYTWVSQAAKKDATAPTGYKYADAEMKVVAFAMSKTDVTSMFDKAAAANTLMAGSCPEITMPKQTVVPTTAGVCVTMKFPAPGATLSDFHATIDTTNAAHVAFFTAHGPTEFERDTHYFMDMATVPKATDVEPIAQNKEFCKIDADANGLKKCQQAFFIIQSHHDYCPHDTLTSYEEKLFHEWESKCYGCTIRRKYNPALNYCPTIDCKDKTVAELGYNHLKANCVAADTKYAFEWAASFDTPLNEYKWVSQAATMNVTAYASNYTYADAEMKLVAFAMTHNYKSELFGLKKKADDLMTSTSPTACPQVTATKPLATITPTATGACVTIKFPDSTTTINDFNAVIKTAGINHVGFFTAHMPTEFERDTHYFMSMDLTTDIEPVQTLGGAVAHDHGRRLDETDYIWDVGHRRLANKGTCCTSVGTAGGTAKSQQGAWKQVVAYHDLCDHKAIPTYIEKGFHDYEASCEDYFCNLVGPNVNQLVCPFPPPAAPPSPSPAPTPPSPSMPVIVKTKTESKMSDGAIGGIAAAVVIAVLLFFVLSVFIIREKQGRPVFTSLEEGGGAKGPPATAPPAVSMTSG